MYVHVLLVRLLRKPLRRLNQNPTDYGLRSALETTETRLGQTETLNHRMYSAASMKLIFTSLYQKLILSQCTRFVFIVAIDRESSENCWPTQSYKAMKLEILDMEWEGIVRIQHTILELKGLN